MASNGTIKAGEFTWNLWSSGDLESQEWRLSLNWGRKAVPVAEGPTREHVLRAAPRLLRKLADECEVMIDG